MSGIAVLQRLIATIEARAAAGDAGASYTARLLKAGVPAVAQKVGEEAVETVIEAVRGDPAGLARESADLLYHLLVLWRAAGVPPEAVWDILGQREGGRPVEGEQ